ncbi:hypothetical protein JAAARDRAFT_50650 [Jaapia argillacea MUCL 33604]|uniref:Uncharacterized protein n=1 Tax=Jaapia argillacea MUCL 33604 TaxID=933084 RepID=A0A067PKI0_9AGAM|nr:hypothetical protein JAAARDRAFT_50650 [Jaapia argillacea MUCL 33604]
MDDKFWKSYGVSQPGQPVAPTPVRSMPAVASSDGGTSREGTPNSLFLPNTPSASGFTFPPLSQDLQGNGMLSVIEMLVDMKIHLYSIENDLLKRYFRIFICHLDFAICLRHLVAGVLLAPCVPAYLAGVLIQILDHIKKNLDTVNLSPACRKDPADWALVKSAVAHELAQLRSIIKGKLELTVKNRLDIYTLTTGLLAYNLQAKKEHWGQNAFLCQSTVKWQALSAIERKKIPFWDFVDNELKQVHSYFKKTFPDMVLRQIAKAKFFADVLAKDLTMYPSSSGDLAKKVYTNEGLTEMQRTAKTLAGSITPDDVQEDLTMEDDGDVFNS